MSGAPLTREERTDIVLRARAGVFPNLRPAFDRYEATVQAAELRAEIAEKALGRVAAIRSNSPDLHSDAVCDIAIFVASEALDDLRALLKSAPE